MAHPITSTVVDDSEFERIRKELENPVYNPKAAKMMRDAEKIFAKLRSS